ncbi:MAG: aminotransferase class I/II-fold pyridoxal phosphate-dependent enzyme [Lachnospiraceae bacterium]|nr:aminotransferase class I/II-fold pyridoxal phosphate-dependent enzyme [Lachnospiraceae bacterium]
MKYDFESLIDRRGMDAIAVDAVGNPEIPMGPDGPKDGFDVIPMWIADMSFVTAPSITEAMKKRLDHPLFGYFATRKEYYEAISFWHQKRNNMPPIPAEAIGYENGVLGGVISALNVLCSKGDNVLLHSPTYIGFQFSLADNGYHMIQSPLIKDENGIDRMDLADMEEKIIRNHIHAAVFCSPHNPTGRVWEREELEDMYALFKKHDVYVVCDEIWSDLLIGDSRHIPAQSISEDARNRTVALYAPSKTFSLAGLIGSYRIVYNPYLRDRIEKEQALSHYNSMNVLSMYALIGAYSETGMEWLDELKTVLTENVDYACRFIEEKFKGVCTSRPQGTYMLFVDCTGWCKEHGRTIHEVEKAAWDVGVALQDGTMFGGEYTLRLNLALPHSRLIEAFDRLDRYVFNPAE